MQPVEFVDYIFDRYAYLELTPEAGKPEIHRAIVRRRAGLHTDKITNLDDELKQRADQKRDLIDGCAAILENDEVRAVYDERLTWFKAEKPHLVSNSGTAILDPTAPRFQYESLLQEAGDHYDVLQTKAAEMTGYDARQDAAAGRRHKARPGDEELRDAYRHHIGKRLTYLTAMEHVAWLSAGYGTDDKTRQSALYPDEYLQLTDDLITDIRDRVVPEVIGQRQNLVALGMSKPMLMLAYEGQETNTDAGQAVAVNEAATALVVRTVQERFDSKAGRIREIARQKQETMEELLGLSPTYVFNRPRKLVDGPMTIYVLAEREEAEPTLIATFNFMKTGTNLSMQNLEVHVDQDIPLDAVRKMARNGPPAIGILHSQPLGDVMAHSGLLMEAAHAAGKLAEAPPAWWQQAWTNMKARLPGAGPS